MTVAINPVTFLRRGSAGVGIDTLVYLLEHPDDLQALRDDLDGRRDAALAAIEESETKLAAAEAREADLEAREVKLVELVADLETREAAVAVGTKAICDAAEWFEANPLPTFED